MTQGASQGMEGRAKSGRFGYAGFLKRGINSGTRSAGNSNVDFAGAAPAGCDQTSVYRTGDILNGVQGHQATRWRPIEQLSI